MHVSRQTFDRIINQARRKIADALINTKALEINENGFIKKKIQNSEEKMKIIVASSGENVESIIDDRFGRCSYFAEYNKETKEFIYTQNAAASGGGAGIKTAQYIIDNADAVIGLNFGPNAFQTLEAGNIKIYSGISGKSVKENIDAFNTGDLKEITGSNVEDHNGMK